MFFTNRNRRLSIDSRLRPGGGRADRRVTVTPKTELPPSTELRKAAFGSSPKIIRPSTKQNLACGMALLGFFWSVACPAAAPTYTLTDLGILPGYIESNAVAVNNAGQIAGNLFDSTGVRHAFVYSNGAMTLLPVVSGLDRATAVSMNNAGQIVGIMGDSHGNSVAFSYLNGTTVALGCGNCGTDSNADDVNDSGQVVGVKQIYAFIFPSTYLRFGSGYTSGEAFSVNKSGQVVFEQTNGLVGEELFLYSNGTFKDLGIAVAGVSGVGGTRPCTINNSGQIIGSFPYVGGDTGHPFLYSNGSVTDLGPAVGNRATLYDINNAGQIVGGLGVPAFVYYINGANYVLSNLAISGGTGWVFYDARGINDSGQIVGRGYNNNSTDRRTRGFLLTPTGTPTPTPPPTPGSLGNVSTRLQVGTGNNVLFAGFIVQGSASKTVLIRSAGPSLTSFGVPGALGNPQLELHDAHNTIGTNDNWQTTQLGGVIISDQVAAIQNSGEVPRDPAEPAIIATLAAGQYTAIVQGVGGSQGIATVELYDLSPNNGAILANISTRGFIQTGDKVMIGGFIVVGQTSRVLILATGPSLIPLGINNALTNPKLELHDVNGTLAANDDWQTTQLGGIIISDQSAAIQNTGLAPTNPAESGIIATLAPGNYTAIAQGVNSEIGVGLVQVFALP
jgi:probable HAF family extracellular repeat protein